MEREQEKEKELFFWWNDINFIKLISFGKLLYSSKSYQTTNRWSGWLKESMVWKRAHLALGWGVNKTTLKALRLTTSGYNFLTPPKLSVSCIYALRTFILVNLVNKL